MGDDCKRETTGAVAGVAAAALRAYDLADADARLIRHNENGTFAISDRRSGRWFLLRVHEPVSANLRGIQHTFEGLSGEMEILRACSAGTGLLLQQPVANLAGRLITTANDPSSGLSALCTLLTWVDGWQIDQTDVAGEAGQVQAIGRLAWALHAWSRRWQPTAQLVRPVYDPAKYQHLVDRIELGLSAGLLTATDLAVIGNTMDAVAGLMAQQPPTPLTWGLIHADLKPDNVIFTNDGPVPIDFCFAGFGYYLFDVGGTLPSLKPPLRRPYVEGYQSAAGREFTRAEWRLIDACFVLSILGGIGFSISNPATHEWIGRRMPDWCARYFVPFAHGHPVALAE
jgi:Ser/Thr protein kinase RdoA (MazF antagonist)